MEDADYIILMDENGQPYIEHASLREVGQRIAGAASSAAQGVGRGVRQNAKYIQKIVDNGKTRYFYTQEELRAYYNQGKQKAQNAYNNVRTNAQRTTQNVQAKARGMSSNARSAAERSYNEARNRLNTTRNNVRSVVDQGTRQAQSLVDQANVRARETYRNIRDQSANRINQAKDKLGFDERQRYKDAEDYWDRTVNLTRPDNVIKRTESGALDYEANAEQQENASRNLRSRREEYYNTPIGKIPATKEKISNAYREVNEKVSNKVKQIEKSAKETIDKIERERDYKGAPKAFKKMIDNNAKNLGISKEEAKQRLIDWTYDYYTKMGDTERRDRYLEALDKV